MEASPSTTTTGFTYEFWRMKNKRQGSPSATTWCETMQEVQNDIENSVARKLGDWIPTTISFLAVKIMLKTP
jgi:hypothetical protein